MRGSLEAVNLSDLYASFSDDVAVRRFVGIFLGESRARLTHLREGLAAGDAERLRGVAHALMSPSRWVGAATLADACVRLQRTVRDGGDLDAMAAHVTEIEGLLADVETALNEKLGPIDHAPRAR